MTIEKIVATLGGGEKLNITLIGLDPTTRDAISLPGDAQITEMRFGSFREDEFVSSKPDLVVCPLFGDGFDVIAVLDLLESIGFSGRFAAIAEALPRPELVRKEVRTRAKNIHFDLINLYGREPNSP